MKLAKSLWDRRDRETSGLFLIEGYRELLRACENGQSVETLFICQEYFLGSNEETLISELEKSGAECFETTQKVFKSLSYRDRPDGLLGIAKKPKRQLEDLKIAAQPFFIIAESIEKPGNLGTILRSADGAGVDGVIVCDACTDIFNPNVVRSSVGTLFSVPLVSATSDETIAWLQKHGIMIVSATPEATIEFTHADFKKGIAIVVGAEQYGLSDKWKHSAGVKVRIPMLGKADSLNVAQATTLLLYEVVRQRNA